MAGSLNKVMLIGNLGKDPEKVSFDNGGMIVKFPIATAESYRNRDGAEVERTEWHNIVVGRKGLAEVCEKYLRKGHKIFVEGQIRTRSWDDNTGNKRYITEIYVNEMTMLGGRDSGDSNQQTEAATNQPSPADVSQDDNSDDLPF